MRLYWMTNKPALAAAMILSSAAAFLTTLISVVLQQVTDSAISGDMAQFRKLLVITVIYMALLCLFNFLSSLSSKYLVQKMTLRLRSDIYNGIMSQSPAGFYRTNTADYISNLSNDVKLVEDNYILPVLQIVQMAVMFAATLVLLILLSPLVTIVLVFTLALMFLIPALLGSLLSKRQDAVSSQLSAFTEKIKDILSGFEVIRGYQMFPLMGRRFERENKAVADCKFAADKVLALSEGLSDTLSNLSLVVVIFASAYLVINGTITTGTLLALLQLSGTFLTPVLIIMENLPKIKGIRPVINKLKQLAGGGCGRKTTEEKPLPAFNHSLRTEELSFSYGDGKQVLRNVSLTFEKGKKYALVGRSGCGKSTLVRLLTGYYDNYSGGIYFDGTELSQLDSLKLGRFISTLHQNVYLFNDTVGGNIALGREYDKADWTEALQNSGTAAFLPALPKGLDSPSGENGSLLSGGQKQRIALARALIRDTPMVILDEGTSAIDNQTAVEIERALLEDPARTLISITHALRSETLAMYDQVIFMEHGAVTGASTLNDLLENCPPFQAFWGTAQPDEAENL